MNDFINEPLLELRRAPVRANLTEAMTALDAQLPWRVPVIVGGERRDEPSFTSHDPGTPDRTVAHVTAATPQDVDAAVHAAAHAAPEWEARGAHARAAILSRAAGELRGRRQRLAALAVRECGKPWAEADADVCETIDFLEYYAQQAIALEHADGLVQLPGERNTLRYAARGVVAVVGPWNFPLAIPAGMVAAGLATGNGVVLKPAEQSPACALAVVEAFHAAGVPPAALNLLPGEGDVGAALVAHPGVHTIAFTGSGAVGLEILKTAAEVRPGQRHLKRVVAEMGGKNCVIVDADADLDDVVPALVYSAFGFAGQKCSAAARALVHQRIADTLVERLHGAVDQLLIDQAERFGVDVPPVIEAAARERIDGFVRTAHEQGARVHQPGTVPAAGHFVAPAVIDGLPAGSRVTEEEIFGPVLAVESVASVDEAVEIVANLPFALTGGLFSRDPATVERVSRALPVGNLYVNRHITGAMVGRQPFGGNRLSGTGTKAGGPDYLLHFVEPRVVTEDTMRHGLVV
ncbi:RHH-type proline utilization regulon transcriptional repressor/proline dehydrogenase/delta 1-pyrroline-5-carboxylate dehydrogenase [Solirubrobacter pauli]|uniref:L-glutamate gamma-semialdehyde dehydrogenase n=1 Tax=Solirubrobacter pauli TaxID=166793 RepID=A0A660L4Y5_9ACTN|nr:aldehyde dehydrogenase family protein [Solirubrobacter pauli]RKQ88254.1 RHH-type proline utilization regulon transcriptional repressor/proline dehydrogenase/delta 1-pyrroline-5-carboxylate dehydrogenase [Solirubrobacter pauli]